MKRRPAAWVYKPVYFDADAIERIIAAVGIEPPELEEEYRASGATAREFLSIDLDGTARHFLARCHDRPVKFAERRDYFARVEKAASDLLAALAIEWTEGRGPFRYPVWSDFWPPDSLFHVNHRADDMVRSLEILKRESRILHAEMSEKTKTPATQKLRALNRTWLALGIAGAWQSCYGRKPTAQSKGPFWRFSQVVVAEINRHTDQPVRLTSDVFRAALGRRRATMGDGK